VTTAGAFLCVAAALEAFVFFNHFNKTINAGVQDNVNQEQFENKTYSIFGSAFLFGHDLFHLVFQIDFLQSTLMIQ